MSRFLDNQTVYLSGPITNHLEHSSHFEKARNWLRIAGHKVLSPLEIPYPSENGVVCSTQEETWCYYMKEALRMLVTADSIYMMEGWEKSKGARMEFWVATELNIPVYYAHEDYKYV